ncbi:MAG: hypothetical protein HY686_02070 [Chloroflexi bacterium]|nr:hypothetical protein [Chloroflexota bacterium]
MPYVSIGGILFHYHLDAFSDPWQRGGTLLLHHAAAGNLQRRSPVERAERAG